MKNLFGNGLNSQQDKEMRAVLNCLAQRCGRKKQKKHQNLKIFRDPKDSTNWSKNGPSDILLIPAHMINNNFKG